MVNLFYEKLINLKDLSPNIITNEIFTNLYNYCINNTNTQLKITQKVLKINQICAEAEYKMELFYANKMITSNDPKNELNNFIYYKNYNDLSELEYFNLNFVNKNIKNILFIWSWPLPLTSIILALKYDVKITLLDISNEAIEISKKLINSLWLQNKFDFICSDIIDFETKNEFDVIYLASLVCQSTNNEKIFSHINETLNFKNILVRTSLWIRQLLYKKIDEKLFNKYFKTLLKVHPENEIINSFIIAKKYD